MNYLRLFDLVILGEERIPRIAESLIEVAVADKGRHIEAVCIFWRLVVCGRRGQVGERCRVRSGSEGIANEQILRRNSAHVCGA